MRINFTKMHGIGNDFIVIDARGRRIPQLASAVRGLASRRFGVGFDQALVLRSSKKADFAMDIYNSDGGRVEMCGNGIRCIAHYIWKRRLSRKSKLEIETLAGIISPERAPGGLVRVDMGEPVFDGPRIPVRAKGTLIEKRIKLGGKAGARTESLLFTCLSMGNPHAVAFVDDLEGFPVKEYGPKVEKDGFFPKRVNVEFVEVVSRRTIKMRVWERGSGETLACGTGASASVVASCLKGFTDRRVKVILLGGALWIEWSKKDGHVYMTGPAEEVFEGTASIRGDLKR